MRSHFICLFLIAWASLVKAEGEFIWTNEIATAYQSATRFDLAKADEFLAIDKKQNPGNGFNYLISNYRDFIKVFIEDNPIEYRKALARRVQRIQNLELCNSNSPYQRYALAEIYLQWTFLRFQQGEQTKAANDLRKAAALLNENQKRFPDFTLNLKGLSIVHLLAGSIPDNMKWLANLAGIQGTIIQGENELNQVIEACRISKTHSIVVPELLFLKRLLRLQLFEDISFDEVAASQWEQAYANEPIIQYITILTAQKTQHSDEVIKRIRSFTGKNNEINYCFFNYLVAEASLNLEQSSIEGFHVFINCSKGNHFKHSALRKMAWYYLLHQQKELYFSTMKMMLQLPNPQSEEDKQALFEAKQLKAPDTLLLRARLLFDGGKAEKAIQKLKNISVEGQTLEFITERAYRLGRCYQQINNQEEALIWLNKSIDSGKSLPLYFAASASYQMGKIYTRQNRVAEAIVAFRRVSQFPDHPYKGSLDAKAISAINRISN